MVLREDERREIRLETSVLELEFSEWAAIFGSRCKEKASIQEGIALMHASQIKKQAEKKMITESLHRSRMDLPPCLELLRSEQEASFTATALNATADNSVLYKMESKNALVTPAAAIRREFRNKGWKALSIEEQQWSILDQEMNPHHYTWFQEKEESDNLIRVSLGKRPKKRKISAVVESVRFTKVEIEHLVQRPFSMLSRKEMLARKLLHKYHDNADLMNAKMGENSSLSFDPHLAERVRAKSYLTYTREEKEWSLVDSILRPDVWRFYSPAYFQLPTTFSKQKFVEGSIAPEENDIDALGKILGIGANSEGKEPVTDLRTAVDRTQRTLIVNHESSKPYECNLSKDAILRIWKSNKDTLSTDEERLVYRLLLKYNGAYRASAEGLQEAKEQSLSHCRNLFEDITSSDPGSDFFVLIICLRILRKCNFI